MQLTEMHEYIFIKFREPVMKYVHLMQLDDEYNDPAQRLVRWSWLLVVVVMPILALMPLPERDPMRTARPFVERHELKVIDAPRLPSTEQTQPSDAPSNHDNSADYAVLHDADFA
jgi:hypothetical protein